VRQVFSYLRAFAEGRAPVVRALADVPDKLSLRGLPDHPSIRLGVVTLGAGSSTSEPLLRVRRPTLEPAPRPPESLLGWVMHGWEEPDGRLAVWQVRRRVPRPGETLRAEGFADDPRRPAALTEWSRTWKQWAAAERPARHAMRVFEQLYALHADVERQGERIELVLADGRLTWTPPGGALIDHPVVLQRVDLLFDPDVPEFRVMDADRLPELNLPLLMAGGLPGDRLTELQHALEEGGFHPLAREETSNFLRRLVSLLGPTGRLVDEAEAKHDGPVIARDLWLLARDRAAGFAAGFDRVLEDIEHGGPIPTALTRIVGIEPARPRETTPGALADLAGAPLDVLLSKPANAEQIDIVRALERHEAVLVQGPPGTGKTHTIANLIGHLVAQGKRVLVTSHATKALRMVREHIVEELRSLSVAVLDNDLGGRAQLEQAVKGIVHRLSTSTEERLQAEVGSLVVERSALAAEIEAMQAELRAARENEYLPIEVAGHKMSPAEAARFVGQHAQRLGLLPGPIPAGASLPLTEGELRELYESNDLVSADEERELDLGLPAENELPTADQFEAAVARINTGRRPEAERSWKAAPEAAEVAPLQAAKAAIEELAVDLNGLAPWQRRLVAAGHAGGAEESVWRDLAERIERAAAQWREGHPLLLEHAPSIDPALPRKEVRAALVEMQSHVGVGKLKTGGLSMLFRGQWKAVLEGCRTGGAPPGDGAQLAALLALAEIEEARAELAVRWARLAEPAGLPPFAQLPEPPEPTLLEYGRQFERLLRLWPARWRPIEGQLDALGFKRAEFRADEIARAAPTSPFDSDLAIITGALPAALERRGESVARLDTLRRWKVLAEELGRHPAAVCRALGQAIGALDAHGYRRQHARVTEAWRQRGTLERRRTLLRKLAGEAPGWAAAVEGRIGFHGSPFAPKDLGEAWRWRQLEQELERRGARDESALAAKLEQHLEQLRRITVELCDRKAWLEQLRRTDLEARQALMGWADTQQQIGRGTGARAPELQVKARELLSRARSAVPVWIMPLSRVVESFDPRHGRFDVVVIDEASQCDLTALFAVYLGEQVLIVGDHEQVSPAAAETPPHAGALIGQFLEGIPNSHLYDGQTSVYDLARQSFGGTIALREHFRCVPDIIEFSNQLSYGGEIRPLRDPNTGRRPHLVEYRVSQAFAPLRRLNANEAEARVVAALVAATMVVPEYEGKTFGAISLLGDEQARRISELVQALVPVDELERRRFLAGNPGQFQGDERDVILLSMVDTPVGTVLPLVDRPTWKQRYNVAASRARDQLWLVHCLDPRRDLHPSDLRRRLIEHVRTPPAASQPRGTAAPRRTPSALEQALFQALVREGFRPEVQVPVGGYRIDMVVSDGRRQVALECDGDRFQALDRIPEEMAKQAVLERVGWRFRRIRASRYYRDPDGTVEGVCKDLRRLGVEPMRADRELRSDVGENLEGKIIRRAWEIMRGEAWVKDAPRDEASSPDTTGLEELSSDELVPIDDGAVAELVMDEKTEPRFVIIEPKRH
jgi:very-short-patch-repair endonuclease/DNA polymerase III delta prime subunit